jgi:hypothetical protein
MLQTIKQLYRDTYAGENIISQLTLKGGEWNPEVEFVPNAVSNMHTTTQAVAIGNGESRLEIDLRHIANHRGGLAGVDRLQSYGCNALYRDFRADFLIATSDAMADELVASGYCETNIVYANSDQILRHPGKFYLIPQNLYWDAGSLAAYMACFDGHSKIFLLGFDGYHGEPGLNNVYKHTNGYLKPDQAQNGAFWERGLYTVMTTYPTVEFVRVCHTAESWIPGELNVLPNFRQINYRQFVLEADIG